MLADRHLQTMRETRRRRRAHHFFLRVNFSCAAATSCELARRATATTVSASETRRRMVFLYRVCRTDRATAGRTAVIDFRIADSDRAGGKRTTSLNSFASFSPIRFARRTFATCYFDLSRRHQTTSLFVHCYAQSVQNNATEKSMEISNKRPKNERNFDRRIFAETYRQFLAFYRISRVSNK